MEHTNGTYKYIYIKLISNPVRITGNLYSSPCVIEEYVCEQLLTLTQESRGNLQRPREN